MTPTLVNYSFNPASRSFSLLGNNSDAGFMAVSDPSQHANPLDTPEFFVRQHYGRFPVASRTRPASTFGAIK